MQPICESGMHLARGEGAAGGQILARLVQSCGPVLWRSGGGILVGVHTRTIGVSGLVRMRIFVALALMCQAPPILHA